MVPLRFTVKIPYAKYEALPQLVELSPKDMARPTITMLDEAIRFYNYPSGGHGGVYADPKHWPLFNIDTIARATNELHAVFKAQLFAMVDRLYTGKDLGSNIKSEKKGSYNLNIHGDRGKICAELFLSADVRNEDKVQLLKRKPQSVYFREFEKLVGETFKLRVLDPGAIEDKIVYQYKNTELQRDRLVKKAIFETAWGGSWIVKPKYIRDRTQVRTWDPQRPIWPYSPREVGPTEALYFCLQSACLEKQRNASYNQSARFLQRTQNPFLQEIRGLCAAVENLLPIYNPLQKRLYLWRQWEKNLDHLAFVFDAAASSRRDAWIEWKTQTATFRRRIKLCGVGAGLPAAIGLIGIIRVYITDLKARVLMTALSDAIGEIYQEISGYTAMGFYEALSSRDSIAPRGAHTVLENHLVGALKYFRTLPFANIREFAPFWVDSPINQQVSEHFHGFHKKPLFSAQQMTRTPSFKKQKPITGDLSFDAFWADYIPRLPVITKEFFTKYLNVPLLHYKNEREYGAELHAQAHVFVAYQLLGKSEEVLHWDLKKHKQKYQTAENPDKGIKKGRFPTFLITDGSNVWGGRNLPHVSHRYGVEFDFDFGPNLIPWPETTFTKWIKTLNKIPKGKDWIKTFLANRLKERKVHRMKVLAVCFTKKRATKSKAKIPNHPPLVFIPLAKHFVYAQIGLLKNKARKEKYFTEKDLYKKTESKFAGTPHFISDGDAQALGLSEYERTDLADQQRLHVGHLAIMMAGPRTMIYASPLIHIRAMYALRRLARRDGLLFLFQIGGSIGALEEYLGAVSGGEAKEPVPELLSAAFFEKGIILSEEPVVEQTGTGAWFLYNYNTDAKYHIEVLSDNETRCLSISFVLPDALIRSINQVVGGVGFGFAPNDHHDHWHVEFHRVNSKGQDNGKEVPYETHLKSTFEKLFPLWCWLGVDLRGFYEYLKDYKIDSRALFKPLHEQRQKLLSCCADYIIDYEKKYGAGRTTVAPTGEQQQYATISKKLCEELFSPFKDGGMLIEPTIKKEYITNKSYLPTALNETIKRSEKIVWGPLISILNRLGVIGQTKLEFVEWQAILERAEFTDGLDFEIDDVIDEESVVV